MNNIDLHNEDNEMVTPTIATPPVLAEGTEMPNGYWDRFVPAGAMISRDGRLIQYEAKDKKNNLYINKVDLATGQVIQSTPAHILTPASVATFNFVMGYPLRTFGDFKKEYMISTGRMMEVQPNVDEVKKARDTAQVRLRKFASQRDDDNGENDGMGKGRRAA